MHTLLDLRGSIPVNIHITDGKWHDDNMWQLIPIERGAVYSYLTIYKFLCEFIATVLLLLIFYHFVTKSVQRYYIFS